MSTHLIEIEKRLGKRISAEAHWQKVRIPSLLSKASLSDFKKNRDTLQEEYLENCLLETHDMCVLTRALQMIGERCMDINPAQFVTEAWNERRLDSAIQAELVARDVAEAERRAKQEKTDGKQGKDIPGQLRIFDDKSEAEAASSVTITKMPVAVSPEAEATANGVTVNPAPDTVLDLADEIENMVVWLKKSDAEADKLWIASGFSNLKTPEQQKEAYQFVWQALTN